jgi:hypothetical protein
MKPYIPAIALCATLAAAPGAAQVTAEPWFQAGTFMFTVEAGGAAFSDFERTQARPVVAGNDLSGFGRRVSAQTAGSVGGWVGYWILNGWGVRAGVSYVPTSFTVWNDESMQQALDALAPEERDPSYASLDVWMANASTVFRFPRSFGRVTPYGIVGAGLIRYTPTGDAAMPPEARSRFADGQWQTAAAMFGIGAAIPLQKRNLLMSFELTNHVAQSPLGDGSGETFELAGIPMQLDDSDPSGSDDVGLTSHFRLALGLTLPVR